MDPDDQDRRKNQPPGNELNAGLPHQQGPYDAETPGAGRLGRGNFESDAPGGETPGRDELEDAENEGGLYNPDDGSEGEGGSEGEPGGDKKSRKNREKKGDDSKIKTTPGGDKDGLYNESGDEPTGRFAGAKSKYRNAQSKYAGLRKKASRNKLLIGFGAGGAIGFIILLIIVILMVGAYKIVDFAEHVAAYQFARTTSQMVEDTTNITQEATAIDSIPDTAAGNTWYGAIKSYYASSKGKAGDVLAQFDKYRPGKVIENMQGGNTKTGNILSFNESETAIGRTYISSVSIGGATSQLETKSVSNSLKNLLIPGYQFKNRDVAFSRDFVPDFIAEMKANDIGPITRARTASAIRKELNIGLVGWLTGKYIGKSEAKADAEQERESTAAAQGENLDFYDNGVPTDLPETAKGPSDGLNSAAQDVEKAEAADLADESKAEAIAANPNETPSEISDVLAKDVSSTAVTGLQGSIGSIVGFFNPVYKYAVPLCLIYDGSIQSSQGAMDVESQQEERSAIYVQSQAGQEKDGTNITPEAVSAGDWKLGAIEESNAEKRASGQQVDTSTTLSTEASPTGQYTRTVADFIPGVGSVVDDLSPGICKTITNTWVGVGVGVAGLGVQGLLALFSGGSGSVAEAGGEAALDASLESELSLADASTAADATAGAASPSMLSRLQEKAINAGSFAKDFAKDTAKNVIAIGALTQLASNLVASQAGGSHSTLTTDKPYDDANESGLNIYAQQINQQGFFGAPMQDKDVATDTAANDNALALKVSHESAFERYADIHNPDSLVTHVGIMAGSLFNGSIFSSLSHLASAILTPIHSLSVVLRPLEPRALADTQVTSVNTYYGNVQFGYTPPEKKLLDSCPAASHDPNLCTYQMIENQKILDESGNEDNIGTTFNDCFTKSVAYLLTTPDPNGDGFNELNRDKNGDVIPNQGLCSPDDLSFDSSSPLASDNDPLSPHSRDMIFRYRVAHGYNNTMQQMQDEQTVTASDPGSGSGSADSGTSGSSGGTDSGSGSAGAPSGDAQQLAQQLLDFIKQGKISVDHEWDAKGDAANGSAPLQNLQETANGQPAKTTPDCGSTGRGGQAPNPTVDLNTDLLKFLVQLAQAGQNYTINALAGECHSSSSSNHYKGLAVDFGCPFDPTKANSIGQQYNISDQTGETCSSGAGHYHYSVGGH